MDGVMRDYLMLASVVSRSPGLTSDSGYIAKANEILGDGLLTIGRVNQVRLADKYIGGDIFDWEAMTVPKNDDDTPRE